MKAHAELSVSDLASSDASPSSNLRAGLEIAGEVY